MNNQKKFRISLIISVAVAIALTAALNMFASALQTRLQVVVSDTYELSDRTKDFLSDYDTPATIYIFKSVSNNDADVASVLRRYEELNSNIKVVNINPGENPTFGSQYTNKGETLAANSVIVASDKRYRTFTLTSLKTGGYLSVENKITPALKYVARDTDFKVYFITGHGELSPDGMKQKLVNETYTVDELDTAKNDIPGDAELLISFRPVSDFSEDEIAKLEGYLGNGGSFQLYMDWDTASLTNLYNYTEAWGIGITDTLAVETSDDHMLYNGNAALMFAEVQPSPFTLKILESDRQFAYLPFAKALDVVYEINGTRTMMPILATSQYAYTAADRSMEPMEDIPQGARMIAGLAEDSESGASVYVSGVTMFMQYSEEDIAGSVNYEYLTNLLDYTLGSDSSFSVNGKSVNGEIIVMSEGQKAYVRNLVIIFIPLAVIICGVIVLIRRRRHR